MVESNIFKTLENGNKTATDSQFLNKLMKWIEKETGSVNVCMRLFAVKEQVLNLKRHHVWEDTYYGTRKEKKA